MLSLATAKAMLRITTTDATRDTLISTLIPIVYADIIEECNNYFRAPDFDLSSDEIYFGSGTINLDAGGFTAMGWPAAGTLVVTGSRLNDGLFTISSQTDTTITPVETVLTEAQTAPGYTVQVALSVFPAPIALIAARMIGYQLSSSALTGIVSESVGGGEYSYTRKQSDADANYPADILRGLKPWKNHRVGRGVIQWKINENRLWLRDVNAPENSYYDRNLGATQ